MLSIIIPAKNEADSLDTLLPELKSIVPDAEILVVDDGSADQTAQTATKHGVRLVSHPYPMGNGAAVKTGARQASGDVFVFMDGDGQHPPSYVPELVDVLHSGFDMVVGARKSSSQANLGRGLANRIYNWIASYITDRRIFDLTSGFRAVKAERFAQFLHLLPNGFSYPTTITMAFFRSGYSVAYHPITAKTRIGNSHIRVIHDGIKFFLIIFKVGTLYSPLKIFLPVSLFFFLIGLGYYGYTFSYFGRFTNMSALLFITSMLVFLIGLVSEQITNLMYQKK